MYSRDAFIYRFAFPLTLYVFSILFPTFEEDAKVGCDIM